MYCIGFSHSAYAFGNESLIAKSSVALTDIPPGALITFLQKGLEYIAIEEHINEVRHFQFILLERLVRVCV
jgi:transducin (beta)-like 1